MELALKIFQFILSISILVTLHEIGHFLPAKWFKTKVDKFFLFFDPYFSIFAMSLFWYSRLIKCGERQIIHSLTHIEPRWPLMIESLQLVTQRNTFLHET